MKRSLALAGLFTLSACVSLGGGKPPETLLTLSSDARLAPDAVRSAAQGSSIAVYTPGVPEALANDRIAVRTGDNSMAYIKDARWADEPAKLFADVLAETISERTGRLVVDRRQYAMAPGARLTGRLLSFGLDAPRGEVVVIYDAALAPGDGSPMIARRFEAHVPSASEKAPAVARALNQATNRIAGEVADWVGK